MTPVVLDLYAGAGGWSEGAAMLGLPSVGIEIEQDPCRTALGAGHRRVRADVSTYPTAPFAGRLLGLTGSPPCQAWSMAGKRLGEEDRPRVHALVDAYVAGLDRPWADGWADGRSHHAAQPVRWVRDLRPAFVTLEQVPSVLGLWQHIARVLRGWGYSTWCGVLNAANFGVPQTRQRAVLIARLGAPATPPEPTHAREPVDDLFGSRRRWVSMAEALGWLPGGEVDTNQNSTVSRDGATARYRRATGRPSPVLTGQVSKWRHLPAERKWVLRNGTNDNACERPLDEPGGTLFFGQRLNDVSWVLRSSSHAKVNDRTRPRSLDEPAMTLAFGHSDMSWVAERPATTVQGDPRIGRPGHKDRECGESQFEVDAVRITLAEAAVLQSFPPDYPWAGTRTSQFLQVGNAVPPLLAARVLAAAAGLGVPA